MDGRGYKRSRSDPEQLESTRNRISAVVNAGETITGTWDDVKTFACTTIQIVGTQPSAYQGVRMETSMDGVTVSFSKRVSLYEGALKSVHTLNVSASYFRLVYVQGTATGRVDVQVIYNKYKSPGLTSSTSQVIGDYDDVALTRTVNDHMLDMSRGVVRDKSAYHKFGSTIIQSAGTYQSCWGGNNLYPFPTTALQLRIKAGGNPNDELFATGARQITVEGLDQDWNMVSEIITTAGASASLPTNATFMRVSRAYITMTGTAGYNLGEIDIETTGGVTLGHIEATMGQTQSANFTVPLGYTAYLTRIQASIDGKSSKTGSCQLFRYVNAPPPNSRHRRVVWREEGFAEELSTQFRSYIRFTEKEDIDILVTASANASEIHINYDFVLIDGRW